jgi:predicted lipopolysaccharide heptosyltransferase III
MRGDLKYIGCRNILLIQLGDVGDVVVTTPAIRAVKESYPDARISILVRMPFGSLLKQDPTLNKILEVPKGHRKKLKLVLDNIRLVYQLFSSRFDLVIDLRTGDRGAILTFLTGSRNRVGRHEEGKPFWYNLLFTRIITAPLSAALPVHPGADQSLRVLREIGIDTKDSSPKLFTVKSDLLKVSHLITQEGIEYGSRFVTVNPFSRWKYKEWNTDKWAALIDVIWSKFGLPIILTGTMEEKADCQKILTGRESYTLNFAGKTSLSELAALISKSTLHLGVDSAAPHIAEALGRPTLTLHGPTDWRAWRIVNDLQKVVSPSMECVPCNMKGCNGSGKSRCLEQLDVHPVILELQNIMDKININ